MPEIRAAMARLKDAQKSSKGAAAYSRFVNRPVGRVLAAIAYTLHLSPTQVTLLSGTATALGILSIALIDPTWWSAIVTALLLMLGYALDSADGQVARLTGRGSLAGEWLDHFLDAAKTATIHLAVFVCWYRFYDLPDLWLGVPLLYGAVASIFFFGIIAADFLRRIHRLQNPDTEPAEPKEAWRSSSLYSLAVIPTDYGLLCLSFVILSWHAGFVVLYTALAAVNLLVLFLAAGRWYLAIRRLETPRD